MSLNDEQRTFASRKKRLDNEVFHRVLTHERIVEEHFFRGNGNRQIGSQSRQELRQFIEFSLVVLHLSVNVDELDRLRAGESIGVHFSFRLSEIVFTQEVGIVLF